jgi:4-hydroxy-tetrahydrodipicolinate reductase
MRKVRIAQFGLGPIGIETLKLAASRPWAEILGGIDINPALKGKTLGDLTGLPQLQGAHIFSSLAEMLQVHKPDVILHTAVSRLAEAAGQIRPMAEAGISVVSSCEELLFPRLRDPQLAHDLDQVCRLHGVRVLGTGVNPGFVMDVLPVCLTGVCSEVQEIHVQRVVDATTRRGPLQRKIGSGMDPAQFERLFAQDKAGHAGLKDSAALIAHALNWPEPELVETCKAMVAPKDIHTPHVQVRRGQCCGLHQRCEAAFDGKVRLTLDLKMYLEAADPHDACQIVGNPPLNLLLQGGVAGDVATVAALVHAAPRILKAPPGLLLMTDIAVPARI